MGLFSNIKNIFKKEEKEVKKKEVVKYEEGLTKSRDNIVSKLANLTHKYNKVNEEYFEELEDILIMADIGVNTVMNFMDRLRKRVREEKIEKEKRPYYIEKLDKTLSLFSVDEELD